MPKLITLDCKNTMVLFRGNNPTSEVLEVGGLDLRNSRLGPTCPRP